LEEKKRVQEDHQKKLKDAIEIQKSMYEQSGADKQAQMLTKLKLRLDKQSAQLTASINYYIQVETFLTGIIKQEEIIHNLIYEGFKTSGVKRIMLRRFKARGEIDEANKFSDDDMARTMMNADNKSDNGFRLTEAVDFKKRTNEIKTMNFDENDITLFDDNNWTCFQLARYLKFDGKEFEMLYALFKACSFEDICDEIRDKKSEDKEKIKTAELTNRLKAYYETKVQEKKGKRDRSALEVKKIKETLIPEMEEELEEKSKELVKLNKKITELDCEGGEDIVEELQENLED